LVALHLYRSTVALDDVSSACLAGTHTRKLAEHIRTSFEPLENAMLLRYELGQPIQRCPTDGSPGERSAHLNASVVKQFVDLHGTTGRDEDDALEGVTPSGPTSRQTAARGLRG
jgi:hypothetical protein